MAQHTEGPWELGETEPKYNALIDSWEIGITQEAEQYADRLINKEYTSKQIITAFAFGKTKEECLANAHVVIASTDLLEALEKIHSAGLAAHGYKDSPLGKQVQSTIAKARGVATAFLLACILYSCVEEDVRPTVVKKRVERSTNIPRPI